MGVLSKNESNADPAKSELDDVVQHDGLTSYSTFNYLFMRYIKYRNWLGGS
jgi:hypothetical protein